MKLELDLELVEELTHEEMAEAIEILQEYNRIEALEIQKFEEWYETPASENAPLWNGLYSYKRSMFLPLEEKIEKRLGRSISFC